MSLYSGFNALGLSTSINDLWNRKNAERQSRINNMSDTLFKILEQKNANDVQAEEKARYEAEQARIAQEKAEAKADLDNRRANAVKTLMANGYTEEEASGIANSFGNPDNAVAEALARSKEKRGREYKKEDDESAFDYWKKQNGISNEQDMFKFALGKAFENLGIQDSKDWGNSIRGVEAHNKSVDVINKIVEKDPKLKNLFEAYKMGRIDPATSGIVYDETIEESAQDIIDCDAPDKTFLIEEFFKELQDKNKLTYFQQKYPDKTRQLLALGDGKRLSPYVLTQDLGKGVTTSAGRKREIKTAEDEKIWNGKMTSLVNAYANGGEKPSLTEADKKKAWNIKKNGVYIYRDALQDLYNYNGG